MKEQELDAARLFFAHTGLTEIILLAGPFVLFLASLAFFPVFLKEFWESHKNKAIISFCFGLPSVLFFIMKDWQILFHAATDYAAFISLLCALFMISGGIYIRGAFAGLPWVNSLFLLAGALISNFIGTTGASMLLIRPLLRANQSRKHQAHLVVFFIFIVSNCSGLLTPLGDPPLFLGFMEGVPFDWTFSLWPQWIFVNALLILLFLAVDAFWFGRESLVVREALQEKKSSAFNNFGIEGKINFILLGGVIFLILANGWWIYPLQGPSVLGEPRGVFWSKFLQAVAMFFLAGCSFLATPKTIHEKNNFKFDPLIEVAILFAGIFLAMIPALLILETQGGRFQGVQPWQFFWASGLLSGLLDNAPTYLSFTSLAKGMLGLTGEGLSELLSHPTGAALLKAISCGAVFMGALTYIGNGPNLMVKAIAEHEKVKVPGFFGYMAWSILILIPIFTLVTLLFFR